ncbi:hypothetical protein CNR22_15085 [Sphingobacteriaceae bacterium]|nr:hypothetical protein CNR22_15085 [Sphingobacteriaceae bacterium]
MMKRLCLFFSSFAALYSSSQTAYFQQRVDCKMDISLNDEKHTVSAFEEINYVNNSPQTLDFIYFHLWPNAYKNNSTALAKQLLWQGKTDFYYSTPEERGYIDSLDFKVNGKSLKWEYDKENIDICKVFLNEPLKASDSIKITTPFFLKIPDAKFSRMGHTFQAYYMTQWYPKPAVYDSKGWHQMPYLDQGEFFSEYGSFDVKITLPDNFVLAATGDRIDAAEEEAFLNKKVEETKKEIERRATEVRKPGRTVYKYETPVSTKLNKTIRFKQSHVHDFAWFADKRFYVLKGEIELPQSKRKVTSWAYFLAPHLIEWREAVNYVNSATLFYSQHSGEYPYNNVSAVDGNIMAGGGMEYPNITVIGGVSSAIELDMVITHEVGHNWFYGILGSNERDNPFLDEGINSFYELRYMREKYPRATLANLIGRDSTFKLLGINKVPFWKYHEISFFVPLRAGKDQELALKSTEYTESNYGGIVYSKSANIMDYMLDYFGENVMDSAMHRYFEAYKFKHPTPNDLFRTLAEYSGKDLKEFQNRLYYGTERINYKIKGIKKKDGNYVLTLKNKTKSILPFNIYAYDKKNNVLNVNWYDGFEKKRTVTLPAADVHHFKIDGQNRMPDIYRKNNSIKTHGLFKHSKPLKMRFITQFEDPSKTLVNYAPVLGANYYDGFMLGMSFHNYSFYEKRFEYLIAPMYAFNTKAPVGFAEFNFNFYPKSVFSHIKVGAKLKTFHYDYFNSEFLNENLGTNFDDLYFKYYKFSPYIQFKIKKKDVLSPITQFLTYSNTNLITDSLDTRVYQTIAVAGPAKKTTYSFVNQLSYDLTNKRTIDPFTFNVNLQHTASMAKISGTLNYKINLTRKHEMTVRVFAGAFLTGNANERGYYAFRASGYNGWNDYLFEGNYVARNERGGFGFSQFMEKDGALKIWTPLGQTGEWMTAVNLKSPKFLKLFKVFADAVVCDGRSLNTDKFLWDAGINISLWTDVIEIYVPLAYNNDIRETLELNKVSFPNTIRFTFNIHKLDAKNILQTSFF